VHCLYQSTLFITTSKGTVLINTNMKGEGLIFAFTKACIVLCSKRCTKQRSLGQNAFRGRWVVGVPEPQVKMDITKVTFTWEN
jgi:hypothetical protein